VSSNGRMADSLINYRTTNDVQMLETECHNSVQKKIPGWHLTKPFSWELKDAVTARGKPCEVQDVVGGE